MGKSAKVLLLLALFMPLFSHAQQNGLVSEKLETVRATVLQIYSDRAEVIPGTGTNGRLQKIQAKIVSGPEAGKILDLDNDYLGLKQGETFYLLHTTEPSGAEYYSVQDPYRLPGLIALLALFVICVFFFGGWQGLRGLLSLLGSLLLIIYVLFPGIIRGYSPFFVATIVSALIITVGSYVTHGFNKTTSAAVVGMISTVILTGLIAVASVHFTKLTGYNSEEAVYLNFDSHGGIDILGLLLGGIMIGLLGVLYDIAIGQAISVEELSRIAPHVTRNHIFKRALRIGREHIGALVNTLAIAYVGAALPLLLLFSQYSVDGLGVTLNKEIFATEIVRTLVGSIGLVLAVPITTAIAVWMLARHHAKGDKVTVEKEKVELSQSHLHGHSH